MNMLINDPKYAAFLDWLRDSVTDEIRERLDHSDSTLESFLGDIGEDGHIEIRGIHSATGHPVTGSFPELADSAE